MNGTTLAAYGGLFAGIVAGFGFGAAAVLQMAPASAAIATAIVPPYLAPEICELPPPADGIGFRILLDEATRRGPQARA